MGGAVSTGRDNNELVDNLMTGNYIRTRSVERVFRVLDRADYMSAEARDQAYKDLAWRNGPLHLSAPCIYSEVMEALDLKPGLSFLNIGSGTGYLSTLVGLIIGSSGISHGVEALPIVTEYANKKLSQFVENSVTLDEYDFCMPKYYTGNGLCLSPSQTYDRVYCGAGVLTKYESYFKQLTKVGGVLVMPLADTLVQMRRVTNTQWTKKNLLNVSFALLRDPNKEELEDLIKLEEQTPPSLQILSRSVIRRAMCLGLCRRHPELREPPPRPLPQHYQPRRIHIPIDADSDEELNALHDLDESGGAHEMNALLSLVLSMGQNRAAGSLRLDRFDDDELYEDDDYDDDEEEYGDIVHLDQAEGAPEEGGEGDVIVVGVAPPAPRRRPPAPPPPPADTPGTSRQDGPVTRSKSTRIKTETKITITRSRTKPSTATETKPVTRSTAAKTNTNTETKTETKSGTSTESDASPKSSSSRDSDLPRVRTLRPEDDSSSADEETQVKESKRQKLDSGIGEGGASSASPDKSDNTDDNSSGDDYSSDQEDTDMGWEDSSSSSGSCGGDSTRDLKRKNIDRGFVEGRPRRSRAKSEGPSKNTEERRRLRARTHTRTGSSDSGAEEGGGGGGGGGGRDDRDARRVRLSLAMKRGIKELPLPQQLKKFVNLGRCFQF